MVNLIYKKGGLPIQNWKPSFFYWEQFFLFVYLDSSSNLVVI